MIYIYSFDMFWYVYLVNPQIADWIREKQKTYFQKWRFLATRLQKSRRHNAVCCGLRGSGPLTMQSWSLPLFWRLLALKKPARVEEVKDVLPLFQTGSIRIHPLVHSLAKRSSKICLSSSFRTVLSWKNVSDTFFLICLRQKKGLRNIQA